MYQSHQEQDSMYNNDQNIGGGCRAMGPGPKCNGRCAQYCARNREYLG